MVYLTMKSSYDTISLTYVETRKKSLLFRIFAIFLILIFVFVPCYEFVLHVVSTNHFSSIQVMQCLPILFYGYGTYVQESFVQPSLYRSLVYIIPSLFLLLTILYLFY